MSNRRSRRQFITQAAFTSFSVWVGDTAARAAKQSPNSQISFASIGVGGKGESDSDDAASHGNMVAICDVDDNTRARGAARFPKAEQFFDFRTMLEQYGKHIDAVTVSIPDCNHAVAAGMAMKMGKHCFCQKPLAHSVWEAQRLADIAEQMHVATEMGNQGTAADGLRQMAAQVQKGAIGKVTDVHVWTNRPIWPQGIERPAPAPVPSTLHWDAWLGSAPARPYAPGYHPFSWRGWWDFGCGALGDMACHTMNLPFMALDLRDPLSVQAQTSGTNHDSYPAWSLITYKFDRTNLHPPLTMTWYDGGKLPPTELFHGQPVSSSGSLMIGSSGTVYAPGDYGGHGKVIDGGVDVGQVDYPHSPGHFREWVRAIQGGIPAVSNFPNYAVPLTKTVVLGNLAVWASPKKIEWDARRLRATNAPEVQRIIHPHFRANYSL
ncbi:MAG: Gfo/Idh/MocA family oxidoreductase [Armatimonadetes bacterium]|nr:Gfo/Idh/MocA family oxidoreductase [Armatimonadota bacterium]MDE2205647.1 Gfo/Idh/MocA family oxidoreductase [Armatimonadota bacterium]